MEIRRWPTLARLVELARAEKDIQVWLFGSALNCNTPNDLDVLMVYLERSSVQTLRAAEGWAELSPPCNIIAMTEREVQEYDFIATTGAVRLI